MGVAPQWIEKPEKLLVFILAIVAKKEQNNYGILYLLYIDNVLFAIQIFGRLMLVFFQANAISQLLKTVEKLITLKDLIILGANVFLEARKKDSFIF